MSIKNPSSCAQANNIGKTADNVKKKLVIALKSSYQPFQPSEKETDPGQPGLTQPSLSPGSCKRKIRR